MFSRQTAEGNKRRGGDKRKNVEQNKKNKIKFRRTRTRKSIDLFS